MEYLPIGSVVTLVDGGQPVMIYGRKQVNETTQIEWDYVACLYPEGNLGNEYTVFFNGEDIQNILFGGYRTKIDMEMQKLLSQ